MKQLLSKLDRYQKKQESSSTAIQQKPAVNIPFSKKSAEYNRQQAELINQKPSDSNVHRVKDTNSEDVQASTLEEIAITLKALLEILNRLFKGRTPKRQIAKMIEAENLKMLQTPQPR